MSEIVPAVLPSKRAVLERAAGFMELHLTELRTKARTDDSTKYAGLSERHVLDATETAYGAGMLREMAANEPDGPRTRITR